MSMTVLMLGFESMNPTAKKFFNSMIEFMKALPDDGVREPTEVEAHCVQALCMTSWLAEMHPDIYQQGIFAALGVAGILREIDKGGSNE